MKISVKDIKEKYPNPVKWMSFSDTWQGHYCVGGALCLYLKDVGEITYIDSFPPSHLLTVKLCICNPQLSEEQANNFATSITSHNDKGRFKTAWKVLSKALDSKE